MEPRPEPVEDLQQAVGVLLGPRRADRRRRDDEVAACLRVAYPRPQEVASVSGAAVERDDQRPGTARVVLLGDIGRKPTVASSGADAEKRRGTRRRAGRCRRCVAGRGRYGVSRCICARRFIGGPIVAKRRQQRPDRVEVLLRLRVVVERAQDPRDALAPIRPPSSFCPGGRSVHPVPSNRDTFP